MEILKKILKYYERDKVYKNMIWANFILVLFLPAFILHVLQFKVVFFRPVLSLIAIFSMFNLSFVFFLSLIIWWKKVKNYFVLFLAIIMTLGMLMYALISLYQFSKIVPVVMQGNPISQTFTSKVIYQNKGMPGALIRGDLIFENDKEKKYYFWYPKFLKEDGSQYEVTVLTKTNLILEAKEIQK